MPETVYRDGMPQWGKCITRLLDVVIAAASLVVFSPLFLYCYLRIRRETNASVIYSQKRVGRGGKPFRIYKFRTMRADAEDCGPQLSPSPSLATDERMLRVGRTLRDHHLDELPQLWNVLKGDMTFVGPRPERPYYIDQILLRDERYKFLYQVRPGVTSYATLYNGYTDTMEKMLRRLELDLYYLQHRSLWLNCKILWLTFYQIISGKVF